MGRETCGVCAGGEPRSSPQSGATTERGSSRGATRERASNGQAPGEQAATGWLPVYRKDGFVYRGCPSCGHAQVQPLLRETELARLYGDAYFEAAEHGGYADYLADARLHRANARDRLTRLAGCIEPAAGALVDVGCAAGYFLEEARAAGWTVTGVDISSWARRHAAARGLRVLASLDELTAAGEQVDAVTFFQSLEHMPLPAAALAQARDCLRPGGGLVIETWDRTSLVARILGSHWHQITPPSVVHLFSRASLTRMLQGAGFGAISIRATGKRVSVGLVAGLLGKKYRRLDVAAGWVASRPWLAELGLYYRLGDLITVTARRRG